MDKGTIKNIVEFLSAQLTASGLKQAKVLVFGSALSEAFNENSDIDIAIISDDFMNVEIFKRSLLTSKAERETMKKFGVPLDVVRLTVDEYEKEERLIAKYVKESNSPYSSK